MQLIDFENITNKKSDCVATIGFFDGVHCGHRFLLDKLRYAAAEREQKTMLVTFRAHPNSVLLSQPTKRLLTAFDEKIALLNDLNIDFCVVLDFTEKLAEMSAMEFMQFLHEKFSVKTLLVGYDHHFGHNRVETVDDYVRQGAKIGVEVIQTQPFIMGKGLSVSSSKIRHLIQDGNIETANTLLGYHYSFAGTVMHGQEIGRKIGFPTANLKLAEEQKILPIHGAFVVDVTIDNQTFKGMMNIGYKPTVKQELEKTIEVNIFDFDRDIYNQVIIVSVLKKLRDEQKFESLEALKEQLEKDRTASYEL
jgi:riboflavin kinase/FMN adenylyltransferase